MTEDHTARTEGAQFAAAHPHITTTHSCLATGPCQCTSEDDSTMCGAQITCKAVPANSGDAHENWARYNEICTQVPLSVSQHCFVPLHTGEQEGHPNHFLDVSTCKMVFCFVYTS